ncbi:MAG: helix-turn-helix domain-containing protein [Bacteroidales bacterium]|jgi:AraC-like DNA-binding protein|nr:helix-turn-helix domain-containing protein [Bacteroidales bacterium]
MEIEKDTEIFNISIEKLKAIIANYNSIGDDFIVSNKINDSNLDSEYKEMIVKNPFRVNALAIVTCTKGSFTAAINLKKYKIEKNMCICNTPYNIFQIEEIDNAEIQIVAVSSKFIKEINVNDISALYLNLQSSPIINLSNKEVLLFNHYLDILYNLKKTHKNLIDITSSLLSSMISWFEDIVVKNIENKPIDSSVVSTKEAQLFEHFIELLTHNHTKERSVVFYADKLNLAPKYFSTIIKNYSHRSASKWINDYVILEAKTLLKYSDLSIKQISTQLNFQNQSFFGKYFKNLTGLSPHEYQNNKK